MVEDEIFDSILGRRDNSGSQTARNGSQDHHETSVSQIESHHSEHDESQAHGIESSCNILAAQMLEPQDSSRFEPTIAQSNAFEDAAVLLDLPLNPNQLAGHNGLPVALASGQETLGVDSVSVQTLMIPSPRSAIFPHDRIAITSATVFGAKLINACHQHIRKASSTFLLTPESLENFNRKLILAAAHLVACCMGLESYLYGVVSRPSLGQTQD